MLKPEDRKSSLEDIPESAFPKPREMPPIPESNDKVKMSSPPKLDLKPADEEHKSAKPKQLVELNSKTEAE